MTRKKRPVEPPSVHDRTRKDGHAWINCPVHLPRKDGRGLIEGIVTDQPSVITRVAS